jgi:uncharacterized membrane protein YjjP (DUF1212 family)
MRRDIAAERRVTSSDERDGKAAPAALPEALDALLRFGALMLRSGETAARTREWIGVLGRKLGVDAVAVALSLDAVTMSVRRAGASATAVREIGPQTADTWRIGELERLAEGAQPGPAPGDLTARLAAIEATPRRHSAAALAAAVAVASGCFAFLNGAAAPEMVAAAIGGGVGQGLRGRLAGQRINQYGAAAVCALAASGVYVVAAALAGRAGIGFLRFPAGLIASVLFLIPGFPLISALVDLLRFQMVAAVSRFAYGVMLLLAAVLGLSIVIALADVELTRAPPLELAHPLRLVLRAVASLAASCALAMLFNGTARTVASAGVVALVANSLRLLLVDLGMMPAAAAFLAALAIGTTAVLAGRRLDVPHIVLTVAPTLIMVPGLVAIEAIVAFNRGQMLDALQAFASCSFVIGALAMGLATARFLDRD